jgi:hypothetical protein
VLQEWNNPCCDSADVIRVGVMRNRDTWLGHGVRWLLLDSLGPWTSLAWGWRQRCFRDSSPSGLNHPGSFALKQLCGFARPLHQGERARQFQLPSHPCRHGETSRLGYAQKPAATYLKVLPSFSSRIVPLWLLFTDQLIAIFPTVCCATT